MQNWPNKRLERTGVPPAAQPSALYALISGIMGSGLAITHLHSLLPRGWAEQGSLDTVKRGEAGSGDLTILITLDFALLHSGYI
jgi:hypothetical protein